MTTRTRPWHLIQWVIRIVDSCSSRFKFPMGMTLCQKTVDELWPYRNHFMITKIYDMPMLTIICFISCITFITKKNAKISEAIIRWLFFFITRRINHWKPNIFLRVTRDIKSICKMPTRHCKIHSLHCQRAFSRIITMENVTVY